MCPISGEVGGGKKMLLLDSCSLLEIDVKFGLCFLEMYINCDS